MKFDFIFNDIIIDNVYHQKFCKKKQKHKNQYLVILKILLYLSFKVNVTVK